MTPIMYRQRTVAFKTEGTYGTFESLTATEAHKVDDPDLKINADFTERDRQDGTLGFDLGAPGAKSTALTFKNFMRGDGSSGDPDWAQHLFPAVGMPGSSNAYATSGTVASWAGLSAALNRGGRRLSARGLMGNLKMTLTSGQPILNEWSFLGGWNSEPTDTTQLSGITFEDVVKPVFAKASAFTLDSATTYKISKAVIDLGTKPFLRHDPNSPGGYIGGWLTNIKPTITLDPEAVTIATKDWFTANALASTVNMTFVAGSATGNTVTIACTSCQLPKKPEENERNGMLVDALNFNVNGTITITFG